MERPPALSVVLRRKPCWWMGGERGEEEGWRKEEEKKEEQEQGREGCKTLLWLFFRMLPGWVPCIRYQMRLYRCVSPCFLLLLLPLLLLLRVRE